MALDYAQAETLTSPKGVSSRVRMLQWILILLICALNITLKAPNLGHPVLKTMDESYHAVVARNLLYDPFKPTLIRDPVLPYDPTNWLENHVWLHKPILPLWQMALSLKLFGVNALAVRLPSLILSTAAILLTFLIARKVYDGWVALIAALIQSIVPAIGMLVQGYVFSDAIDISLLFWSELSIYLMLLNRRGALLASGCAAGAAFLSKTFPALYVLAPLALVIWQRASPGLRRAQSSRTPGEGCSSLDSDVHSQNNPHPSPLPRVHGRGRMVLAWIIGFLIIAAPWNIYTALRFPTEFKAEHGLILQHLSADVENWSSPWDRLWFQHLPGGLYLFWTTSVIGAIVLSIRAIQLKQWMWLLAPTWIAAVLIPFTLATSKTPSASLIAWPALMICAGFLIVRGCCGYLIELLSAGAVLLLAVVWSGPFIQKGWGVTRSMEIMLQAKWILAHLTISLGVLGSVLALDRRRTYSRWAVLPMLALMACLLARTGQVAWRVRHVPPREPAGSQVGAWIAKNLPENVVLFVEAPISSNSIMFYANRTAYPVYQNPTPEQLMQVKARGYIPYLIEAPMHLPQFWDDHCCVRRFLEDNSTRHWDD